MPGVFAGVVKGEQCLHSVEYSCCKMMQTINGHHSCLSLIQEFNVLSKENQ
jgi:hypothetical protein